MARLNYSLNAEGENISKAMVRELRVSPKYAVEICRELKGKKLAYAKSFLEDVINLKKALPLRSHMKGVAHRGGLSRAYAGRYPRKAASAVLALLKSAEANAAGKGMEVESLRILHMAAKQGRTIKGYTPRAFGRATQCNTPTSNVEIILGENYKALASEPASNSTSDVLPQAQISSRGELATAQRDEGRRGR